MADGRMALDLLAVGGIAFCLASIWSKAGPFMKKMVGIGNSEEVHDAKEDYFSQLSDDELSTILAHLSLGDPARTSSLSIPSMPVPKLEFNCLDMFDINPVDHSCCPSYQKKFLKGVNQVLQLYSGREVGHVWMACCFGREFSSEFDQCMHSISRLSVEELCLYFHCGILPSTYAMSNSRKMFKFSLDLLPRASSLKHLCLFCCTVQPDFSIRLKSLRTLNLIFVSLESKQLESILSSCLNLDKLHLRRCKLPRKLCVCGTTTSVVIYSCGGLEEIDLQAANLRRFECSYLGKVRLHFSDVPRLEHVMIQDVSLPYLFGDFARDLPARVKSLSITAVGSQLGYFPLKPQAFRGLTKLSLVLAFTCDFDILNMSPLLGACPLLQHLDLAQEGTRRKMARIPAPLSPIYHTKLKKVAFGGFRGTGAEIEFVLYILRSAAVLEEMLLNARYRNNSGCGREAETSYIALDGRKRNSIMGELNGQAISKNAVVIIQ